MKAALNPSAELPYLFGSFTGTVMHSHLDTLKFRILQHQENFQVFRRH